MTKMLVMWLFYLFLLIPAFSNNHIEVSVVLTPFSEPIQMRLSTVILLCTSAGVLVTVVLAIIDRSHLGQKARNLEKEIEKLKSQTTSLKEIATMERDGE